MNNLELLKQEAENLRKANPGKYYCTQIYDVEQAFLKAVLPTAEETKFFGPRVFNILILAKPYGWEADEFEWPRPELKVEIDRVKEYYERWSDYVVHIYIDFSIAEEADDPVYLSQLSTTEEKIVEMCKELEDYGFEYKGHLPKDFTYELFQPDVEKWYKGKDLKEEEA